MGTSAITILIIITMGIPLVSLIVFKLMYTRYKSVKNVREINGFDCARSILDSHGLNEVFILETTGDLANHYDYKRKAVKITKDVYGDNSLASLCIASYYSEYAIQDNVNNDYFKFRTMLLPYMNIAANIGYILIIIGMLLLDEGVMRVGVYFTSTAFLFTAACIPLDLDAYNKVLYELKDNNMIETREEVEVKRFLAILIFSYMKELIVSLYRNVLTIINYFKN